MTVIKTNLLTQLQARINAVGPATTTDQLIQLRRAARNLGLDEQPLDAELSSRISGFNGASTIDALFEASVALPAPTELAALNEIRPFFSDQDTLTDQFGGFWLRSGVVTYDSASYPGANKLPHMSADNPAVTPVNHSALANLPQKKMASNGSLVIGITANGTQLYRMSNVGAAGSILSLSSGQYAGSTYASITYCPRLGLFILLGYGSLKIFTSPDGVTWTPQSVPAGTTATSSADSSLVFAAAERIHLFILNKHYTTENFSSWSNQADTLTPNAAGETTANRKLFGCVQAPAGNLLLWGSFYSVSAGATKPYLAFGALALTCPFDLNDISSATDSELVYAAARTGNDFEIGSNSVGSAPQRKIAVLVQSATGSYTLSVIESSVTVPTAAINYNGLLIRGGTAGFSATNVARAKALPYNVVTSSFVSGAAVIRVCQAAVSIVRLGDLFMVFGSSGAVSIIEFRWMIGLPTLAPVDNGAANTVGSYAAQYVRIK